MLLRCAGRACGAWIAATTILVLTGGQACGILYRHLPCVGSAGHRGRGRGTRARERSVPLSANPTGLTINGRLRVRAPMVLVHPFSGVPTRLEGGNGPPGARSGVFVYDVEISAD